LINCCRYKPVIEALTNSALWLPEDLTGPDVESRTLLGPFFRLSPTDSKVAKSYFSAVAGRDRGHIANSQNATRMTLRTHQDELFDITNCFIKSGKATREKMLDWFASCINLNHKRSGQWRDEKQIASDGFMINLTV
jgi:ubiquitin conjugation factor E4 B